MVEEAFEKGRARRLKTQRTKGDKALLRGNFCSQEPKEYLWQCHPFSNFLPLAATDPCHVALVRCMHMHMLFHHDLLASLQMKQLLVRVATMLVNWLHI